MEDSIAVKEHARVDYSVISHQIVGVYRHFDDNTFDNKEDAGLLESDLFEN